MHEAENAGVQTCSLPRQYAEFAMLYVRYRT